MQEAFTEPDVTPEELIEVADRAMSVFEDLGDDLGLARAWRLHGQANYLALRLARCAEDSERALEIADNESLRALVLASVATFLGMQAEAAAADEWFERARAMLEESGDWVWLVTLWRSFVLVWRGDGIAAEAELRPGYHALAKIGERSHFSTFCLALGNALYLQARYDEADELARECEAASRPNDVNSQIGWRATRAKVLARRGEHAAAEELARASLDLAGAGDLTPAHADARMDAAEVLELVGRPEEAAGEVRRAIDLYEQKGNDVAATAARERLVRLEAGSAP
jgi:tetratricopeptide (TPR) repeat protein